MTTSEKCGDRSVTKNFICQSAAGGWYMKNTTFMESSCLQFQIWMGIGNYLLHLNLSASDELRLDWLHRHPVIRINFGLNLIVFWIGFVNELTNFNRKQDTDSTSQMLQKSEQSTFIVGFDFLPAPTSYPEAAEEKVHWHFWDPKRPVPLALGNFDQGSRTRIRLIPVRTDILLQSRASECLVSRESTL